MFPQPPLKSLQTPRAGRRQWSQGPRPGDDAHLPAKEPHPEQGSPPTEGTGLHARLHLSRGESGLELRCYLTLKCTGNLCLQL